MSRKCFIFTGACLCVFQRIPVTGPMCLMIWGQNALSNSGCCQSSTIVYLSSL